MKMTVKDAVADILKQEGVEYVFGYTGGHIMHMWEAANNAGIKLILNKQEGNGTYMADGYARVSGKVGVVLGTAGPGVTNMVTGLATALLDSVPLLAIGATVSTTAFGRNAVQDGSGRGRATEQRMIFKAACKQAMLAPSPQTVPQMVREAFRLALAGRKGPVYVEIPSDFWNVEIEYKQVSPEKYKNLTISGCGKQDVEKIESAFYRSQHPLVILGEGAEGTGVSKKFIKFIEGTGVPFAASPMAKNLVDEHHKLYLGVPRDEGKKPRVYEYMQKSDFILFLGDRMQEWELRWYDENLIKNAKLIQVDPDEEEIGRVFPVDLSAVGSISSFIDLFTVKKHSRVNSLVEELKQLDKEFPHKRRYEDGNGINPININNLVEERIEDDGIVVCDTGYAKSMAIMKFRTNLKQKFVVADKNGPMGFSVPAALGAALASGKEVVSFSGDGGFQMTLNELGTAMNYGLKAIYIVLNNGGCVSMVDFHTQVYGHHCADTFKNPDFAAIARAYGLEGYTVKTTKEFEEAFLKAKKAKTSVVIDAKLDQSKMVWE